MCAHFHVICNLSSQKYTGNVEINLQNAVNGFIKKGKEKRISQNTGQLFSALDLPLARVNLCVSDTSELVSTNLNYPY